MAEHGSRRDLWVALRGLVYDMTTFADAHPGGYRSLVRFAGQDATGIYEEVHTPGILQAYGAAFIVGRVAGWEGAPHPSETPPPPGLDGAGRLGRGC